MKERPILFSGQMVRAILDGRKTRTRRVVKGIPRDAEFLRFHDNGEAVFCWSHHWSHHYLTVKPPHGGIGDRLWVRETFMPVFLGPLGLCPAIHYRGDDSVKCVADEKQIPNGYTFYNVNMPKPLDKWTPSIFMPRWASRINLEITGVRVERLQDISAKDVESEGLDVASKLPAFPTRGKLDHIVNRIAKDMFRELWDSLYGKIEGKRWEDNPNVWVYEFKSVN